MGKYIETALPLAEINDAAIREKAGKRGYRSSFSSCGTGRQKRNSTAAFWTE